VPHGLLSNAQQNFKLNVLLTFKEQLEHVQKLLKLKVLILLLILNALRIFWLIKNIAGHASVPKLRRKDGISLDVDDLHHY
jgi:hypothetical protein